MRDRIDLPMMVRSVDRGGFVRVDDAFREQMGLDAAELGAQPLRHWIEPADQPVLERLLERGRGRRVVRHRNADGGTLPVELQLAHDGEQAVALLRIRSLDTPVRPPKASGDEPTITNTLTTIAQIVEQQNPGYRCSIVLAEDGRFVGGAGPSLPDDYNAAIDGHPIGPFVGSCGTAMFWEVPVVSTDLQADPLWAPFRELTRAAGVHACWSHPFTTRDGRMLGALSLYAPEPRAPTAEQLVRLRAAARMTGLAVERGRAEEALREQRARELELEEQLRQAAKMEALGVLAGGVAHDFNNVLATILANAELALDHVADVQVAAALRDIVEVSRRAGGFCQQMLAYAGRGPVEVARLELGALLPEAGGLAYAGVSKKVRLAFELHPEPVWVEGDENQLLQVVLNLITNAAEAIGDERGRIVVRSELASFAASELRTLMPDAEPAAGTYAVVSVSDTGCGMDAATQARMFDPFFTTKFTGRGLGLAAVRGIVAKHGGAFRIVSAPGEGTTVSVLLPASQPATTTAAVSPEPRLEAAGRRILVVDDEDRLRTALRRRLSRSGFEVVEAADGQQALDRFREDPTSFDCVLLDMSMPEWSGDEVHAELVALRPDVPVVLMSGYASEEVLERFETVPPAGFLQKPIGTEELLETLGRALTGS